MLMAARPESSQYLQVPKTPSRRSSRSRSKDRKDRPRETYPSTETSTSPYALSLRTHSAETGVVYGSYKLDPCERPSLSYLDNQSRRNIEGTDSHRGRSRPSCSLINGIYDTPPTTPTNAQGLHTRYNTLIDQHPLLRYHFSDTPWVPLRQKLIGTWTLESYVAYPTPTSLIQRPTFPMTKNVTGFVLYTPDGYMAAQMLIPGQQKSFHGGKGWDEAQWAEAGKRCFAYCGPYYITEEDEGEVLRHTFQCCTLPGWIGDIQIRTHRFEDDGQVLVLGSKEPTEIKGDKRIPVLKWRRARDNAEGVPPPPMPQIKISGPGEP